MFWQLRRSAPRDQWVYSPRREIAIMMRREPFGDRGRNFGGTVSTARQPPPERPPDRLANPTCVTILSTLFPHPLMCARGY